MRSDFSSDVAGLGLKEMSKTSDEMNAVDWWNAEMEMSAREQRKAAYQMSVTDATVQIYMQRYPFATGPDAAMNTRCLAEMAQHLRKRDDGGGGTDMEESVVRLAAKDCVLPGDVMERLTALLDAANIPVGMRAHLIDDFGWDALLVPQASRKVLVIGCGDGIELLFLRAMLPRAELTALDYKERLTAEIKVATGVRFFDGDWNTILDAFEEKFDLVFSNHTLEHLYEPDRLLQRLCDMMEAGGTLLSTLPMDAEEGVPFEKKVLRLAAKGKVHASDVVYLDLGHPWKTNPADLRRTLMRAGFGTVELYQRTGHLSRSIAASNTRLRAQQKLGSVLHTLVFGVPHAICRAVPKPGILLRVLLAAERRVWFGANNLKNRYTPEICAVARK